MKELALAPKDEAFMAELYKLMENELDNPELDITRMAELLKISRTKFYYKVKINRQESKCLLQDL